MREARKKKLLSRIIPAAALACMIALGFLPSGYFTVSPGPVVNLADVVKVAGVPEMSSHVFMVSIVAQDASIWKALMAAVDPSQTVWLKKAVMGSMNPEEYLEYTKEMMRRSQITAARVACNRAGANNCDSDKVSIDAGETGGPSAGLAFALEIYIRLSGISIPLSKVAATGVLNEQGDVLPVGGIAQKTIACEKAGIEVFLVPRANLVEARSVSRKVKVVGVSRFEDALEALQIK